MLEVLTMVVGAGVYMHESVEVNDMPVRSFSHSVVFIANTGRNDPEFPDYLKDALERFEREGQARYLLVAHDLKIGHPMRVTSEKLGLSGEGESVQYALLNMLGNYNPGKY